MISSPLQSQDSSFIKIKTKLQINEERLEEEQRSKKEERKKQEEARRQFVAVTDEGRRASNETRDFNLMTVNAYKAPEPKWSLLPLAKSKQERYDISTTSKKCFNI